MKIKLLMCVLFVAVQLVNAEPNQKLPKQENGPWIVDVHYQDIKQVRNYAAYNEPWHVNTKDKYFTVSVDNIQEYENLFAYGFQVEINQKQTQSSLRISDAIKTAKEKNIPIGTKSIPGFDCYRTVEETFNTMDNLVATYPNLASIVDIGDSWEKTTPGGLPGYDLRVIKITNSSIPGPKPIFFAMSSIHARELTPAELNTRFAEYLLNNYGSDADATWLVDHHEIHLLLQGNPDGRKIAEGGDSKRKNENNNHCSSSITGKGVDMNRNFGWKWGEGSGSSGSSCNETYRGPSAQSEYENQAIDAYMKDLFDDNRGEGLNDPAPDDTPGLFLDIHSYSELVMWPYGYDSPGAIPLAPNHVQFQTLGRKLAWYNDYIPQVSNELYGADGASDDNAYGQLGVAAYVFELGTSFFQSCSAFESTIYPDNLQALIYAAKVSRTPYITASGPDVENLQISSSGVIAGNSLTISGTATDLHFSANNGNEATQNISSVQMFVDELPWDGGSTPVTIAAGDGVYDSKSESFSATIDTTGMPVGQHVAYFVVTDTDMVKGVPYAKFFDVWNVNDVGSISGVVTDALSSQPVEGVQLSINDMSTTSNAQGEYNFDLLQGSYTLTADKSFYANATFNNLAVTGLSTTTQDIQLQPLCALIDEDVESYGSISDAEATGWSHGSTQGVDDWGISLTAGMNNSQSFYTNDVNTFSDKFLISPEINISANTTLEFWHKYSFEGSSTFYDGAVLEITTNNGSNWQDLGSAMTEGGYNVTLASGNPLGSRSGWGGSNNNYSKVAVDLSAYAGSTAKIRWRFASDVSVGAGDWDIDDIQVLDSSACIPLPDLIFEHGFE